MAPIQSAVLKTKPSEKLQNSISAVPAVFDYRTDSSLDSGRSVEGQSVDRVCVSQGRRKSFSVKNKFIFTKRHPN